MVKALDHCRQDDRQGDEPDQGREEPQPRPGRVVAGGNGLEQPLRITAARDFDGPPRDPVQFRGLISVCQTVFICAANYDALTVPAGKRLVITQVYVRINAQNPGPGGTRVTLKSSVASAFVAYSACEC